MCIRDSPYTEIHLLCKMVRLGSTNFSLLCASRIVNSCFFRRCSKKPTHRILNELIHFQIPYQKSRAILACLLPGSLSLPRIPKLVHHSIELVLFKRQLFFINFGQFEKSNKFKILEYRRDNQSNSKYCYTNFDFLIIFLIISKFISIKNVC